MQDDSCCDPKSEDLREDVQGFYSQAAAETQENLCCPTQYDGGDLSHIPEEVLAISYGCGSPVNRSSLKTGETLVDLGSGGGIDCFIASKLVGETGKVIGIDMTDAMMQVARGHAKQVSDNLGYSNVDFKKGILESLPLDNECSDVVTSNCVLNLSPEKQKVFDEIRRILKPGGRFVISDIIAETPVPKEMQQNKELWGECVSGALTLDMFLQLAKNAGFDGIRLTKDYFWKEVEGIKFFSYILEGHKAPDLEQASCCKNYLVTYRGPFASVMWNDQTFKLGTPVSLDEEKAMLLMTTPFQNHMDIEDPENLTTPTEDSSCCD